MAGANFLFYNGKLTKADKLLISPDNRSFRYGDGFFGGDFREAHIFNGQVIRKGWYIDPKTGQRIETDF